MKAKDPFSKYKDRYKLDEYEQEIEDSFDGSRISSDNKEFISAITKAAKEYVKNKKSITLRVHSHDIEVIKIKASKLGIPYQTYINMIIHKDVLSGM